MAIHSDAFSLSFDPRARALLELLAAGGYRRPRYRVTQRSLLTRAERVALKVRLFLEYHHSRQGRG